MQPRHGVDIKTKFSALYAGPVLNLSKPAVLPIRVGCAVSIHPLRVALCIEQLLLKYEVFEVIPEKLGAGRNIRQRKEGAYILLHIKLGPEAAVTNVVYLRARIRTVGR